MRLRPQFAAILATLPLLAAAPAFAAQPTQAQMVQELYDRQMILELMAAYGFAMDAADGAAFAKLFTDDGVLIAGGGEAFRGKAELTRLGASAGNRLALTGPPPKPIRPIHHKFSNVSMDIKGNTASIKAYWIVVNGSTGTPVNQSMGYYLDKAVKRDGRWIYTERRIINEVLNIKPPGK
ncbi:MAG: nuclear transport factor 2 family protein [Caulobacteraceae bacterium]